MATTLDGLLAAGKNQDCSIYCQEVRSKSHDFVGHFSKVVLGVVIDKTSLCESTYVIEPKALETVTTCQQFTLEYGRIVLFTNGSNIDVKQPIVLLGNSDNLLLTFVGRNVQGIVQTLRQEK